MFVKMTCLVVHGGYEVKCALAGYLYEQSPYRRRTCPQTLAGGSKGRVVCEALVRALVSQSRWKQEKGSDHCWSDSESYPDDRLLVTFEVSLELESHPEVGLMPVPYA